MTGTLASEITRRDHVSQGRYLSVQLYCPTSNFKYRNNAIAGGSPGAGHGWARGEMQAGARRTAYGPRVQVSVAPLTPEQRRGLSMAVRPEPLRALVGQCAAFEIRTAAGPSSAQ